MALRITMGALCLLLLAPQAAAETESVRLAAPRPFGYFLGDVIHHEAEISVDRELRLDSASTPKSGPRTYWLDIRTVQVTETEAGQRRRYVIKVDYQSFFAPIEPRKMEIPSFAVSFSGDGRQIQAQVPAWQFLASPLREIAPPKGEGWPYLRPDITPSRINISRELTALAAAGALALLSLAALACDRSWPPFHRRRSRPFAQAARCLARKARQPADEAVYTEALLTLHRAFDAAAGRRILADDVGLFLRAHPAFERLHPGVERFYAASRRVFFGAQPREAMEQAPLDEIVRLSAQLRAAERRAA